MIVCGIDSSSRYTAIAWFEDGELVDYELIDLHYVKDSEERIAEMIEQIYATLDEIVPDYIYQETTWISQNPKTAIQLTTIVGAVRGWCTYNHTEWNGISPSQWRGILGLTKYKGERKKLKELSVAFVKDKFNIEAETDDVADAICIGLAGCKNEVAE